jgi:signal transduction histidine kinase
MQLSEGLPLILGDRVQLQQVILNLIMNAIEAMSEVNGGSCELLISTSQIEPGAVLVKISDTGPGLPSGGPEGLFEAFYTTKDQRSWHGFVDLPLNRRGPWGPIVGDAEPTPRRCFLHDATNRKDRLENRVV